jgi:hypothetical protein
VTNDPDILRHLLDASKTPETVCRIEGIQPAGEEAPFAATAIHREIDAQLQSAARGGPISSPSTFSVADQSVDSGDTGELIIYRINGNPMAPPHSGPGDRFEPSGTRTTVNESDFTLLGMIERNCALDSPKQLV